MLQVLLLISESSGKLYLCILSSLMYFRLQQWIDKRSARIHDDVQTGFSPDIPVCAWLYVFTQPPTPPNAMLFANRPSQNVQFYWNDILPWAIKQKFNINFMRLTCWSFINIDLFAIDREEMQHHIWNVIVLVAMPLIQLQLWQTWENICSEKGDFLYMILPSPSRSK